VKNPDNDTTGHDGHGRFIRTIDTAERDAECARLRARDHTYQQIADATGFTSASGARFAVERALARTITEPGEELRRIELMKLDALARAAWRVLEARHYLVSQGRLIRLEDGAPPLEDDGPVLASIDRLLKISERRSKLLGLDSPVRMEVLTIDAIDAQLAVLDAEIAGLTATNETPQIEGPAS
jgi:hypothetical protein